MPTSTRLAPLAALLLLVPGHATAAEGKIRMYEKDGSFNIDTPSNAGDVLMDGESLNGLFATVEALQAQVDTLMGVTTTKTTTTTQTTLTTEGVVGSIFQNQAEVETIKGWVGEFPGFAGKAVTLEPCYSMAEAGDGGLAATFNAACAGKGPTVTVVKTSEGYIFGGATDQSWRATDPAFLASDVAFLFCIKCYATGKSWSGMIGDAPSKLPLTGASNNLANYVGNNKGPIFGNGHELVIADTPGKAWGAQGEHSYSTLGQTYTCPVVGCSSDCAEKCKAYLGGMGPLAPTESHPGFFIVADYEVFVLKAT